jgi:hypothetical protein
MMFGKITIFGVSVVRNNTAIITASGIHDDVAKSPTEIKKHSSYCMVAILLGPNQENFVSFCF